MAQPKHRSQESPGPEERGEEAKKRRGPEPAGGPPPAEPAGENVAPETGRPGEEPTPEFFVMEPEPPESEEEFVLAPEGEAAPAAAEAGGKDSPEWLLRG